MRKNQLIAELFTEFGLLTMAILGLTPKEVHVEYSIPNLGKFLIEIANPAPLPQEYCVFIELIIIFLLITVLALSFVLKAGS